MNKHICIVGAGLAGLSAALEIARQGHHATLISSLPSERAQSVMAEGGINAAINTAGEDDTPEEHFSETWHSGCELADPNAVWNLTHAAPAVVHRLADLGVPFNRQKNGNLDVRHFGGQKKKRTAFCQSDTGKQLMTTLIDAVRQAEAAGLVRRLPHHEFVTLLTQNHACGGVCCRDAYTGELHTEPADGVIIATGGLHGLFYHTTGSRLNTGAVTAELYRLGLPVANGEFIQYHPTTAEGGGKSILISEAARGEGGRLLALRNGQPWYFMEEKYPELKNLMPRDITSREIYQIEKEQPVFLDLRHLSDDIWRYKLSGLHDDCAVYLGLDARRELIPIHPGIHYFMGGLYVDEDHCTPMANLYAAGECCAQYHGANRLGGNSLLGAIYGGWRAARTACSKADGHRLSAAAPDLPPPQTSPAEVQSLQKLLSHSLNVIRSETEMQAALPHVQALPGPMARLGEALLLSALARKESRGAHWRSDYPKRDEQFRQTTLARFDGAHTQLSFVPIPEKRDTP